MSFRIKRSTIFEGLAYLLLFLLGFQFQDRPQVYIFLLGLVGIVYMLSDRIVQIPLEFFVLALTFTVYFYLFKQNNTSVYIYHYGAYWIGPIVGYLIGYEFIAKSRNHRYRKVKKIIIAICSGTTAFALGCSIYKFLHMDIYARLVSTANLYITMRERYGLNIWSNELIQPTNLNSMCVFSVLLLFYVLNYEENKKVRMAYGLSFLVAMIVVFTTASRTNLVILPMGVVLGVFFSRRDIRIKLTRKRMVLLFIAAVVLLSCSFKIIDFLENSLLARRTESLDNNRMSSIIMVLKNLDRYPRGNMPYNNAHNMWVDVARVAGIAPMILLIIYTVMIIGTMIKMTRNHILPQEIKTLFLTLTIGILVSFAIEPVIEGRPFNFVFFCVLNGMCAAIAKSNDKAVL